MELRVDLCYVTHIVCLSLLISDSREPKEAIEPIRLAQKHLPEYIKQATTVFEVIIAVLTAKKYFLAFNCLI